MVANAAPAVYDGFNRTMPGGLAGVAFAFGEFGGRRAILQSFAPFAELPVTSAVTIDERTSGACNTCYNYADSCHHGS